ncbi:MAG: hypothetical protein AB8B87_13285 [Granulosicoccus sp.]
MQGATDRQNQPSVLGFDVLSSMISELVRHHERRLTGDEPSLDWQSPSAFTRIVKFGTSGCLFNVVNQVPDAVAVEYQLLYKDAPVFAWCEYRWPHLHDKHQAQAHKSIEIPQGCLDELMAYHIDADTSWLGRYRSRLNRKPLAQIDEVGIVAQGHCLSAL